MSKPTLQQKLNMANKTVAEVMKQNALLKTDNELLENSYTEVNKDYKCLLDKFTEISAENYALKAEIERTNRHINLAENQLNKEQQPLVVNHYHNCVINK
jgi:septal ring factor EnvC (AmiA/AmiB activator)